MSLKFKKILAVLCSAVIFTSAFAGCKNNEEVKPEETASQTQTEDTDSNKTEDASLFVYCGAGLKKPMTKLAKMYEEKEGVAVEYTFAGSGQLIAQLQTTGKGDILIIGSEAVYKKAQEENLVGDYKLVAHHTPCIAVPKGNPANIEKLEDLANDGVKVILGDKEANAIGKTAANILKKNSLESINQNVIATPATVNEMVAALTAKNCDAAIVTKDSVFGNEDIEVIEIDPEKNIDQIIPIGVAEVSDQKDAATKFIEFVSSEKGKEVFAEFGFAPFED